MKFFRHKANYEDLAHIIGRELREEALTMFHRGLIPSFFFNENYPNCSVEEADYFIVSIPVVLPFEYHKMCDSFIEEYIKTLPFVNEKTIFFLMGDAHNVPPPLEDFILFHTSCTKDSKPFGMYYLSWLDPAANVKDISEAEYDFCFLGNSKANYTRWKIKDICKGLKNSYFKDLEFHAMNPMDQVQAKGVWEKVLTNSKFVFCPRGVGLNSIRFFEVLSYDRIPILMSDNVKLPLEGVIDYSKICVQIGENDSVETAINKLKDLDYRDFNPKGAYKKYFTDIEKFLRLNLSKLH